MTFIGVSVDQNQDAVAPFVKEMGDKMEYTVAIDDVPGGEKASKGTMADRWMEAADQHGIPTAFIVRDGKVAWIGHPMAMDEALEKSSAEEFDIEVVARPYRAQLAYNRKQFAAAARLWAEALASDPTPAGNRQSQHRYKAARAAARAAAAQGQDEPPLDDAAKAKLRGQAFDWLKAELSAWKLLSMSIEPGNKELVAITLAQWKQDTDLAGIRDEKQLAKLAEDERKQWQSLWADVAALLEQARRTKP